MTEWIKELWHKKVERERGEEKGEQYPEVFIWREQVKNDETLKKFFDLVCQQLERYTRTIKRRQEAWQEFVDAKSEDAEQELKAADHNQKLAHEALMSAVNFFTRNCAQKEIQIDIDLGRLKDRDWSCDWAMKNADIAKKIIDAEEKIEVKSRRESLRSKNFEIQN